MSTRVSTTPSSPRAMTFEEVATWIDDAEIDMRHALDNEVWQLTISEDDDIFKAIIEADDEALLHEAREVQRAFNEAVYAVGYAKMKFYDTRRLLHDEPPLEGHYPHAAFGHFAATRGDITADDLEREESQIIVRAVMRTAALVEETITATANARKLRHQWIGIVSEVTDETKREA